MTAERMILRSREILEYPAILDKLESLAVSYEGKERCRTLEPISALAEADKLQAETEDTLTVLYRKGQAPLQGLHRIRPSLKRVAMPGAVLGGRDLLQIGSFLEAVERLQNFVPENNDTQNHFYDLLNQLIPQLALRKDILKSILGDDEIADDASPELFRIRQAIKKSQSQIRSHLEKILRNSGDALQEQLITLRQDRFVVPVKIEHRAKVPGIVHDTSQSGQTLFVEPLIVVEENNKLRELHVQEEKEIERILAVFSQRIRDVRDELEVDVDLLAAADFFWAKARLAQSMRASRPVLNDVGIIDLKQARHPQIDPKKVVPIDFFVGEHFRTLLITGPNTGGKTVSLKTCGLLSLMAMSGLHIPAQEESRVSVFEKVLADIGDEQSIEQSLSTFSSHMRNIVEITELVDEKCLVLTDELGSGTDPSEGAALAVAILEDLRSSGCITVATTHYKELKVYALQTEGLENGACEFNTDTLQPTYKLLIGIPGSSNAFIISRKLGLREGIIERAQHELSNEDIAFERVLADVDNARIESEKLLREARQEFAAARTARAEAETEAKKIRQSKQDILTEAREEKRRSLRKQNQEIEALLSEMNRRIQQGESMPLEDAEAIRQLLRSEVSEIESEIGSETLRNLRNPSGNKEETWEIGDSAYSEALGLEGKIATLPDNKGQVLLRSGQLQVSVPISGLAKVKEGTSAAPKSTIRGQKRESVRDSKRRTFTSEINILGKTTAEGEEIVSKFIDDAVLAGAESVRIVHGKGTGALRKAVQDQLARDPRVSSFRLGAFGEGDAGVTIAELKNG